MRSQFWWYGGASEDSIGDDSRSLRTHDVLTASGVEGHCVPSSGDRGWVLGGCIARREFARQGKFRGPGDWCDGVADDGSEEMLMDHFHLSFIHDPVFPLFSLFGVS